MSKVKMTVAKLKTIKEMRDLALKRFNKLDAQLRKACTHPKRMCYTTESYHTDTLGNNGYGEYQDHCGCCEAYLGESYRADDRRYGGTMNEPNYELRED